MIFNPGTYVRLLTNVPLDNTYTHTLSFNSVSEQSSYFNSLAKFSYDKFSYQRYDPKRGPIAALRIPEVADNLYNVNYIMFRNNNFSSKWFYAFVKEINYINDGMTEIIYEIDILQTWYFDYKIQPSFVIREHVNDDTKYKNFIEEDIGTGEYMVGNYGFFNGFQPQNCYTVVSASFPVETVSEWGVKGIIYSITGTLGYIYNQLTYYAFESDDTVTAFIQAATNHSMDSGIINIFPYPKAMWPGNQSAGTTNVIAPAIQTVTDKAQQMQTFGSYKPKNNKLYCYPYSFIYVTNNNGSSATFRYELFKGRIAFAVCSCLSCAPDFVVTPMNYKQSNNLGFNWNEAMGSGPLPYGSWITDVYKAYLAQNQSRLGAERSAMNVNLTKGIVGGVMGAITSLAMGNIIGATNSTINGLFSGVDYMQSQKEYLADLEDRARLPPQANSSAGNETGFSLNLRNFGFYNMQVTEEYARIIDQYFTMYGYQVNTVKVPNVKGRKSWNYVKTSGVNIIGNMPADDLKALCAIYDNGITFWHTKDVGNYNLDNSIVGGV